MKYFVLIAVLIFSALNPVVGSGMWLDNCCDEHVEGEFADQGDQAEDNCGTDCCFCHTPTNQALCNPSGLAYFTADNYIPFGQFSSPTPIFLSTPLRPPIS